MQPYWKLESRLICVGESFFKIRRISHDRIIFHLPKSNQVISSTFDFLSANFVRYKFSDSPQAIQHIKLWGQQYILAGCIDGTLQAKILNKEKEKQQNIISNFKLGITSSQQNQGQNYINDICKLSLAENRIINCYNNGTLAIWDLSKQERVHRMPNVHHKYTYKLRNVEERVFSCGYDKFAVVTDIQMGQQLTSFCHQEPVWCAQPLNYNLLATVGLFGNILIWDIRSNKVVLSCQLQGQQSSFVTQINANYLATGDQNKLVKADLRKFIREPLCKDVLLASAEYILPTQQFIFVGDRRCQICRLSNSATYQTNTNPQILQMQQQAQEPDQIEDSSQSQNQLMQIEIENQQLQDQTDMLDQQDNQSESSFVDESQEPQNQQQNGNAN